MAYTTEESNNGLYFIVGGLVVLALFGFLLLYNNEEIPDIAPAAGYTTTDTTPDTSATPDTTPDETSTELRIDRDGVSSTTTRTETESE
jgi:hypothetical protein